MKYFIGSMGFKTKTMASAYVKNFINKLKPGDYSPETEEYKFIFDVLKNHSNFIDKLGPGILFFNIEDLAKGKHISFMRKDGSYDDFSYNHCCQFRPNGWKENSRLALSYALRLSIAEQIKNYRLSVKNHHYCFYCNSSDELEVDHIYPFSHLIDDFLKITQYIIPTEFINAYHGKYIFKDEDKPFEADFINYHLKNAKYQFLCKKCNGKKSNHLEL